jgi:hypothetical protein
MRNVAWPGSPISFEQSKAMLWRAEGLPGYLKIRGENDLADEVSNACRQLLFIEKGDVLRGSEIIAYHMINRIADQHRYNMDFKLQ